MVLSCWKYKFILFFLQDVNVCTEDGGSSYEDDKEEEEEEEDGDEIEEKGNIFDIFDDQ